MPTRARKAGEVYPHVATVLQRLSRPGGLTVEIGCGGKQYGAHVRGTYLGVDERDDLYAGPGPDLVATAEHLPLRAGLADLVFCVAAFYQMRDSHAVLRECRRVLRPGGWLAIFDYAPRVTHALEGERSFPLHHYNAYTLCRLLRAHGFTPRLLPGPAPTTPWKARLARAPLLSLAHRLCGRWLNVAGRRR